MKDNIGPLGFPRLTQLGPFVGSKDDFSQAVEKDELNGVILQAMDDRGVDRDDPSDEEEIRVIEDVAETIYPQTGPVNNAKRARLAICMQNDWADGWSRGLAESTKTANSDDEFEMMLLKFKGCIGITESNVPDDIRLIPDKFK